jgi:division protein CdvB (Snf7/Vps24/ESCRT-III family)
MKIAKNNIKFRQQGQTIEYSKGDIINDSHQHVIDKYFSGQVVEDDMFKIKYATININPIKASNNTQNALTEIRESIEELKESIIQLTKAKEEVDKNTPKDNVKIIIDDITVIPQEDLESVGVFGDSMSGGTKINDKVKKLKKVMENRNG